MRLQKAIVVDFSDIEDFIKEYKPDTQKLGDEEEYTDVYNYITDKLIELLRENKCDFFVYYDGYEEEFLEAEDLAEIIMKKLEESAF